MLSFQQYLDKVNGAIAALKYPERPALLYAPIAYTMDLGGKRIRPVLTLMACEALGGNANDTLDAAVGLEMFHNFTLLHDDVMDRADMRRGKPTVHCRWNDNVAILSGDTMLTLATQLVARSGRMELIELFNRTAIEIYEGQQHDMDFESRDDVTIDEYMEMIRLKTSVLLGCACKMGALVASAREDDAETLYQMGVDLGLAFQLQDDWLDVWGDPKTFGKEIGGDIANNKKTFLLINALNRAEGENANELKRWLSTGDERRDDKVRAVTAIYERLGLKELARKEIEQYSDRALQALAHVQIGTAAREAFTTLINRLTRRDR
ncbi:MAG: polyprenyl synthetase family protein [Muribaculaceae bacterium]|nr:polyprenyl synthetase family protein [Muribaculaceae bacterium]